eukprot:scaffold1061_cov213-Prasinococcus_capsulatus_cf.AAC.8
MNAAEAGRVVQQLCRAIMNLRFSKWADLGVADRSNYTAEETFEHSTCFNKKSYVKGVAYHREIVSELRVLGLTRVRSSMNRRVAATESWR